MCCLQLFHAGPTFSTSPRMSFCLLGTALARDPPLFLQLFPSAEVPALIQAPDEGYSSPLPHGCREGADGAKTGRACSARAGSCFLRDPQVLVGCPGFWDSASVLWSCENTARFCLKNTA